MRTEKNKTAQDPMDLFMEALADKYQPANTAQEASQLLSTDELIKPFEEFSGVKLDKTEVYHRMIRDGFKYQWLEESFCWLVV